MSLGWLGVLAMAAFWNLWYKERQAEYLQRMIMGLPILKTLYILCVTANVALCKYEGDSGDPEAGLWVETANKYLIMTMISLETLF